MHDDSLLELRAQWGEVVLEVLHLTHECQATVGDLVPLHERGSTRCVDRFELIDVDGHAWQGSIAPGQTASLLLPTLTLHARVVRREAPKWGEAPEDRRDRWLTVGSVLTLFSLWWVLLLTKPVLHPQPVLFEDDLSFVVGWLDVDVIRTERPMPHRRPPRAEPPPSSCCSIPLPFHALDPGPDLKVVSLSGEEPGMTEGLILRQQRKVRYCVQRWTQREGIKDFQVRGTLRWCHADTETTCVQITDTNLPPWAQDCIERQFENQKVDRTFEAVISLETHISIPPSIR